MTTSIFLPQEHVQYDHTKQTRCRVVRLVSREAATSTNCCNLCLRLVHLITLITIQNPMCIKWHLHTFDPLINQDAMENRGWWRYIWRSMHLTTTMAGLSSNQTGTSRQIVGNIYLYYHNLQYIHIYQHGDCNNQMTISDFQCYDVSFGVILHRAFKPICIWLVEITLNYQVTKAYIAVQSITNMLVILQLIRVTLTAYRPSWKLV